MTWEIRRRYDIATGIGVLEFLHHRDYNPVKLSDIEGIAASLSERVNLVNEQDAGRRLRKSEELSEVKRCLAKVCAHDGIKPNHKNGK